MRRFLEWFAQFFMHRAIYDRDGFKPYLSRFYILGAPSADSWDHSGQTVPTARYSRLPFGLFLHKFHMSDEAGELHNHPWKWSVSLILAGGYVEERRHERPDWDEERGDITVARVLKHRIKPWHLNVIRADDFHRVDLLEADCWSLLFHGPRSGSWGFWDRYSHRYTPWRDFIAAWRKGRLMRTSQGVTHDGA